MHLYYHILGVIFCLVEDKELVSRPKETKGPMGAPNWVENSTEEVGEIDTEVQS